MLSSNNNNNGSLATGKPAAGVAGPPLAEAAARRASSEAVQTKTLAAAVAASHPAAAAHAPVAAPQVLVPLRVALRVRPPIIHPHDEKSGSNHHSNRPAHRVCVHIVPGEPQVVVSKDVEAAINPAAMASAVTNAAYAATTASASAGGVATTSAAAAAAATAATTAIGSKVFTFDHVYGPESSQMQVFQELAEPLIRQFFEGFNATILAYGQTFSGKTFTMGSSNDHRTQDGVRGIIPRVVKDIFERIHADKRNEHQLRVSFLEIYQEQIRDLLMPNNDQREISIRENKHGTITIAGIHEESVSTPAEMMRCLERGGYERTTGDTQMHSLSSRSHAIFTITLEQIVKRPLRRHGVSHGQMIDGENEPIVLRRSKLHLVDLAGSERLKRTGAEGVRLRESVKINSGLLALGNVISVLGTDPTRPCAYRDSKLTRLLQDSLGGNSRTVMIACISPLEDDMDETLNTLKYAYRARKIHNKPIVNIVDNQASEIGRLQDLSDQPISPTKAVHETIDFDNEQWIQYFMEELKSRTIRGTNATKALQVANDDKAALETRLAAAYAELEATKDEQAATAHRLDESQLQLASLNSTVQTLAADASQLADALAAVCSGTNPAAAEEGTVRALIAKHATNPAAMMPPQPHPSSHGDETSAALPPQPPATSANAHAGSSKASRARLMRRQSMAKRALPGDGDAMSTTSTTATGDASSVLLLKPLEQELHETQKKTSELERMLRCAEDAQRAMEGTCAEVTVLRQINSELKLENMSMQSEMDALQQELNAVSHGPGREHAGSIMSIKILNEVASQTEPIALAAESVHAVHTYQQQDDYDGSLSQAEESEFPVHIRYANQHSDVLAILPSASNVAGSRDHSKLTQELNTVMKAKVDLLRELSKVNKEAEKARHTYLDGIQRLERELDAAQRELAKVQDETHERDQAKDKLKEEYERKLKIQESNLQKLKTKTKELERGIRDKDNSEKRLQDSQQEMEKVHAQLATWKKKLREDTEKFAELEQRRSREIAGLNRQIEEDQKRIRQLETQLEVTRKKLDRRTEEMHVLMRKFKESAPGVPGGGTSAVAAAGGAAASGSIQSVVGSVRSQRVNSRAQELDHANEETSTQFSAVDQTNDVLSDVDPQNEAFQDIDSQQQQPQQQASLRARSAEIESFHRLNKRLREIRAKVDETDVRIREVEAAYSATDKQALREQLTVELEHLRRDKTVLLRHVVEIRTEKRRVEASLGQMPAAAAAAAGKRPLTQSAEEHDPTDYSQLIELFADDPG
ncbi:hypothetical protein BC831DRAFT_451090 [Entophlyctis helioformis]|nr:hypothetical protein BC831DRAFT_451090 [Entophlyctis helioformis]